MVDRLNHMKAVIYLGFPKIRRIPPPQPFMSIFINDTAV